jgi:SAM-dependent methyltransferase
VTADPHWYRSAFGPLTAAFWTGLVAQDRIEAEARFLADALAVKPGASVLDVPCGAGRQARALARLGCRVTGVDISPHMLAASGEPAAGGVELRLGEMDAPLAASFDGAYCWGNSFGYLSHERSLGFLRNVAHALRPGARFVLDVAAIAENVLAAFQATTTFEKDGVRFNAERSYDVARSAMEIVYTISRGDEVERFAARQLVYTSAEILRLTAACGMEPVALYASIEREPAALERPLILVLKR